MRDEDLQHHIEKGLPEESLDGLAYHQVFEALKVEPEFLLKAGFADSIIDLLEQKEAKREKRLELVAFISGITVFIAAFIVAAVLSHFKVSVGAFRFIGNHLPLIVFGVCFVVLINWAEKRLLNKKTKTH